MRVQLIVSCFPTEKSPVDGIFHRSQAEALSRAGVEVEVVGPVPWVPPGFPRLSARWNRYAETPRESRLGDVRVLRPRYLEWPRGNHWASPHRAYARAAVRLASARPDVVHGHFSYPCGTAAAAAARHFGSPSVLTLHGGDVNVYPEVNGLARRRFVQAVRGVTSVLAVAEPLAARTEQLTGRRPRVLPIGINLRPYAELPSRADARRALGLPVSSSLVLFVGRLTREKGIRELLDALRIVEGDVRGVFVGEGPLEMLVRESPRAIAVGLQRADRVPLFLAAADLLVLPSYSEGLPTVLVEAGAAKVPVVATDVGGIPGLLGTDRGRLVPARSVPELAAAIARDLKDRDEAEVMGGRLQAFVREAYDVDRNARALISLYEDLLAGGARPAAKRAGAA